MISEEEISNSSDYTINTSNDNLLLLPNVGQILQAFNYESNYLTFDPSQATYFLYDIGSTLFENCFYDQSFLLFQECLRIAEQLFGNNHCDLVPILNSLAEVELSLSKYSDAKQKLDRCIELCDYGGDQGFISKARAYKNYSKLEMELGNFSVSLQGINQSIEKFEETGITKQQHWHELSELYLIRSEVFIMLNKFNEAQDDIQRVIDLISSKEGQSHQIKASIWATLGLLYLTQGRYQEARETLENSLTLSTQLFPGRHLKVAKIYEMLGSMYLDLEEYDEALKMSQECFDICAELFKGGGGGGGPNYQLISCLKILGSIYSEKGDYEKAKSTFDESFVMAQKLLGESHPMVADIYFRIASIFEEQSGYTGAIDSLEKALKIYENIYNGEPNCTVSAIHNNMGVILTKQNNLDSSLEHYKKALDITLQLFGEFHPDVSMIYMNIGVVLGRKGDPLSQITQYKKALKIDKQIFGKSHNGMATLYHNFGEAYTCLGEYEKARKKYKKALDIKLKKYGQDHPSIALTYFLKGVLNYKQKNYERALELLDESLKIRLKFHDEKHVEVAKIYRIMGMVHQENRDLRLAENYFQKSYQIRKVILGNEDPGVTYSKNRIAMIKKDMAMKKHQFDL